VWFDTGVIMAVFAGGASLLYFVLSAFQSDARRTRRVLRKTRVTPIAELVDGTLACVVGKVEPLEPDVEPLTAMITRTPCVAYDTTIQFFRGNDFSVPERVDVTRKIIPFTIADATGRLRVDAPQAALCNKPAARSERFEERLIVPGATIRIVGSVRIEPERSDHVEHGYREHGRTRATLTGTAKWPLLVDVED
jgi:hypothetical protein